MSFARELLAEVQRGTAQLDGATMEKCAASRERGDRIFILGGIRAASAATAPAMNPAPITRIKWTPTP